MKRNWTGTSKNLLPPWRSLYNLDSYRSWGCFVFTCSWEANENVEKRVIMKRRVKEERLYSTWRI